MSSKYNAMSIGYNNTKINEKKLLFFAFSPKLYNEKIGYDKPNQMCKKTHLSSQVA